MIMLWKSIALYEGQSIDPTMLGTIAMIVGVLLIMVFGRRIIALVKGKDEDDEDEEEEEIVS